MIYRREFCGSSCSKELNPVSGRLQVSHYRLNTNIRILWDHAKKNGLLSKQGPCVIDEFYIQCFDQVKSFNEVQQMVVGFENLVISMPLCNSTLPPFTQRTAQGDM
jgi:hypothetical protein